MRRLQWISKAVVVVFLFCAGLLAGRSSLAVSRGGAIAVDGTGPAPAGSALPVERPAGSSNVEHGAIRVELSPRVIAQQALDCTVYLRGGPVYGAGVLIDRSGHVLTADHVVDGVKEIHACFHGSLDAIAVEVVERDAEIDLALLKLERVPEGRQPARLGTIVGMEMGDEVFAMGAPRKMQFSLSRGVVSYVGRQVRGTVYLQTDLAANEGSSGGPVMNDRGELVGVASFILRKSQGLAFAVPVDYAYRRFDGVAGQSDAKAFQGWLDARRPDADDTTAAAADHSVVTAGASEATGR